MIRRRGLALLLIVATSGAVRAQAPPPVPAAGASDGGVGAGAAATVAALDTFLAEQKIGEALPSLAVGVIAGGALIYQKGFGGRDLDSPLSVGASTVYRIGSITKTFTALAIQQLQREGKLSLDEPAVRYLPELAAVKYPTADKPPITLRHLLTHTSGLPRLGAFNYAQSDHDVTEGELLAALRGVVLLSSPGTQKLYSNFGFALLGVVVGRVAGVPYRDYVSRNIFAPLGMAHSRWSRADVPADHLATAHENGGAGAPRPVGHWRMGAAEAAGGIYSTVGDLGRYVVAQLIAAKTNGPGLAWNTEPSCADGPIVWHDGITEGYSAYVAMLPQRAVAVIALANLQFAVLEPIVYGALRIVDRPAPPAPRDGPATATTRLRAIAGQIAALDGAWNEATYATLLAPVFARPRLQSFFKEMEDTHGRCRVGPQVETAGTTKAVFTLLCERNGDPMLELTISPGEGRVMGFWIRPPLAWFARHGCAGR